MGQRVQGTLLKISNEIIDGMISEIISKRKVASGELRSSFLGLVSEDELKIFNDAEYAKNVDLGRRPGRFPNVNKLQNWIRIKFGNGPYAGRGMAKPLKIKDLTYLIGRKIANQGYPGINYVAKAFLNAESIITKELGDAYLLDLEEQLEKEIPNLK